MMLSFLNSRFVFFIFIVLIFIFGWIVQANLFLNWDVSELLNSTRLLLSGGTYSNNFFTANPPMILYLYMPPVIFSHFFHFNIILPFRSYIFALTLVSFLISYSLANRIFKETDELLKYLFLSALLIAFLLLPMQHLGQRDSLLVILTMPYLLVTVCRLQGEAIRLSYSLSIGLLAALGFLIKPQFILTLVLVELYYAVYTKKWFACLKPESISIAIVSVFYVLSIIVFFPDFILIVMPAILHSYYNSIAMTWSQLLLKNIICFFFITIGMFFIENKDHQYKILNTVLLVSLIGFIGSYLLQRTEFYYHLLPAFTLAIILLSLLLGSFVKKYFHFFSVILALFVISYPIYTMVSLYQYSLAYKRDILDNLIGFMRSQPANQSIYFFTQTNYSSPLRDYINIVDNQRFDCLWMVGNLVQQRNKEGDFALRQSLKNNSDRYFFLNMIIDDLRKSKPDLIFVDSKNINVWLGANATHFDYIDYFTENPQFKDIWNSYQYLTTLGNDSMRYKLQVYQRIHKAGTV